MNGNDRQTLQPGLDGRDVTAAQSVILRHGSPAAARGYCVTIDRPGSHSRIVADPGSRLGTAPQGRMVGIGVVDQISFGHGTGGARGMEIGRHHLALGLQEVVHRLQEAEHGLLVRVAQPLEPDRGQGGRFEVPETRPGDGLDEDRGQVAETLRRHMSVATTVPVAVPAGMVRMVIRGAATRGAAIHRDGQIPEARCSWSPDVTAGRSPRASRPITDWESLISGNPISIRRIDRSGSARCVEVDARRDGAGRRGRRRRSGAPGRTARRPGG